MFEKLERGLFMCFLFAIVGVTGIFWKRIWDLREEQIQFLRLAEEVKTVRDETEVMEYAFRGEKDMLPEYKGLWEKNGDLAGWVSIDGTGIDYPVMWTPDDPEYYLHRNFEREKSYGGTPFAAGSGFDLGGEGCVFLYGHNMRDRSMFAKLNEFQKEETFRANPEFYIYTPEGVKRYQIFSCYVASLDWDSFTYQFENQKAYKKWQTTVKKRSLYDTGIVPKPEQTTVTLMTCTPAGDNYRFLVHGVLTDKQSKKKK